MTTKKCNTCEEEKELHLFSRNSRAPQGRHNICKACWSAKYKNKKSTPEQNKRNWEKRKVRHPEKIAASDKVKKAVKCGSLEKPTECGECGLTQPLEGHHDDYLKPMEVVWLCKQCHIGLHKERGAYANNGG